MRVNNYDWKTCYLTVSGKDTNRGQTDGNKSCGRKKKTCSRMKMITRRSIQMERQKHKYY